MHANICINGQTLSGAQGQDKGQQAQTKML